jgi:hypothetical protein
MANRIVKDSLDGIAVKQVQVGDSSKTLDQMAALVNTLVVRRQARARRRRAPPGRGRQLVRHGRHPALIRLSGVTGAYTDGQVVYAKASDGSIQAAPAPASSPSASPTGPSPARRRATSGSSSSRSPARRGSRNHEAHRSNLKAARLLRAAEGKAQIPGMTRAEAQFRLAESVSTGDFPVQVAPLVRRQLQQVYQAVPKIHGEFTTRRTVQNIDVDEQVNVYTLDDQSNIPGANGGDTFIPGGLPQIGRRERYPQIGLTATGKTIRASKLGEGFGIDWESIVRLRGTNVNLISDAINAFGRHAAQQEDIDVLKQLVKSDGFSAKLTGQVNGVNGGQAMPGNPDLSDPTTIRDAINLALNTPVDGIFPNYTGFKLITTRAYAPYAKATLSTRAIINVPARTGTASAVSPSVRDAARLRRSDVDVTPWLWLSRLNPNFGRGWMLVPVAAATTCPSSPRTTSRATRSRSSSCASRTA